jgi:hypothetical protein
MKEALKLALEALWTTANPKAEEAITAIKAALAQPAQEPWCMEMNGCKTKCADCPDEPAQEPVAWMDIDEKGSASGLRYWSEPDNRHEVALYMLKENT